MALLVILILGYIAVGVGLIRLSMWLTKRIPFLALRIAIHTAVFTFWFMPGMAASEGGAMPGPMWLIVLEALEQNDPLDWPTVAKMFGACWGVTWIVTLCGAGIFRWLQKKESAAGVRNRLP